jgi:inhibitor of the pro-sigma K processing machinery
MGTGYEKIIVYLFLFIMGILFLTLLASPMKRIVRILINSAIGACALIAFNFLFKFADFSVGINPGSVLVVGILGIPGFLLIVFLKYYLY